MLASSITVARSIAAHERFEWRAGMLAVLDGRWLRLQGPPTLAGTDWAMAFPDLTDAATAGVLVGMLGETEMKWPDLVLSRTGDGGEWEIKACGSSSEVFLAASGHLGIAAAEALLALWGKL